MEDQEGKCGGVFEVSVKDREQGFLISFSFLNFSLIS